MFSRIITLSVCKNKNMPKKHWLHLSLLLLSCTLFDLQDLDD